MTYPPPLTPVFPAGYGDTPAGMDALIQAPLGFCATGIVFRAHQTISQTFTTAATWYALSFDTVDEDPWSGWNAGTNQWTPPASGTGWYEVTFSWSYASSLGFANSSIVVSGTRYVTGQNASYSASGGSYIVPLTGATDYVEADVRLSVAGRTSVVSSAGFQSAISIAFIST